MPVVGESLLIRAPQQSLFDLAQDYRLRLKWDPFLRDMRFLNGAREAAIGVWRFKLHPDGSTEVIFRYVFETRWRELRWL